MAKKDLESAFSDDPLTEEDLEFEKPHEVELDEDGLKLVELGISPESVFTVVKGWNKRHNNKKKVFHPSNDSLDNITKGFWEYALDTFNTVDILKIDLEKLPESLADLTRKQIENKGGNITDDLYRRIATLQEERDDLAIKLKNTAKNIEKTLEIAEVNQSEHDLLKLLIDIFIEKDIKTDKLSKDHIQLIKEMMEE